MEYKTLKETLLHIRENLGYTVDHGKKSLGNMKKRMVARKKASMPLAQKIKARYVSEEGDEAEKSEDKEKVSDARKKNLNVNFEPILNNYN